MSDETLSAAPDLDTPATPATAEPANVELENQHIDNGENADLDNQQPDPIEEDDFDWEGKALRVPKTLKERLDRLQNMDADYTQKSQANAARAKELDERTQRIEQQAKASEEELQARASLHHIDAELKRFEAFDWSAYQQARQADPIGADEAWNYVQHLKAQKADAVGKISEAETKRTQDAERDFATRVEQARAHASKLPGWKQESELQSVEYARSKGISDAEFARLMSPAFVEVLHFARMGEAAAKAKPKVQTPAPEPTVTVAGKSSPGARKSLADMDMDEYAAARKAGRAV